MPHILQKEWAIGFNVDRSTLHNWEKKQKEGGALVESGLGKHINYNLSPNLIEKNPTPEPDEES
jgi:hypothetical protein